MGRNERCWCGSGKKWKHCHRDREAQQPGNVFQHFEAVREQYARGECLHPEAGAVNCGRNAIRAHSVQRNGGLSAIAEAGHVLSVKAVQENRLYTGGAFVPKKVGIGSASTFPGFCSRHDAEMFRPVEAGSPQLDAETCFLLSFRALALEVAMKKAALRVLPLQREFDKGKPFEFQAYFQELMNYSEAGHRLALADLQRWKHQYDQAYLSRNFEAYRYCGAAFDGVLPFVAAGAFHPEFDFQGKPLQKLGVGLLGHEGVTFNVTVLDGRTVAVLGWTGADDGPAAGFATSFVDALNAQGGDVIIRLALEHLENTYLKSSWWDGLSPQAKTTATQHMRGGGIEVARTSTCLLPDREPFISGFHVTDTVGT
jgi:hypothetical protein